MGVPLTPQSLRDHCCVAFTGFSVGGSWEFDLAGQSKRVPVEARLAVKNVEAAVDACCAGLGVGAFLDYQVRDALHQGKLVRLLGSYERAAVPINLLVLQLRTASPRVRSFIDWAVPRLRERLRRPR